MPQRFVPLLCFRLWVELCFYLTASITKNPNIHDFIIWPIDAFFLFPRWWSLPCLSNVSMNCFLAYTYSQSIYMEHYVAWNVQRMVGFFWFAFLCVWLWLVISIWQLQAIYHGAINWFSLWTTLMMAFLSWAVLAMNYVNIICNAYLTLDGNYEPLYLGIFLFLVILSM